MATNSFLDALNKAGGSIAVGNTSYNTEYLKSAAGKTLLDQLTKQASADGYKTFTETGTGMDTKLGSIDYNPGGAVVSNNQNNYTFGQQKTALDAQKNGDNSLFNALGVIKTDANGNVINSPQSAQPAQPLQQAIQQSAPKATDNSGMINSQYDSIATALKAAIAQQKNNKEVQIGGLNAKYQPMKNANEVNRNNNLRSVLEQNANNGDRGGVGRQNALQTQTAMQNANNQVDLQKSQEETSLRNDISNLILEGDIQGAQNQATRLKDLIANNQYVNETDYNRSQDSLSNALAQQTANNNQAITDANLKESETNALAKQAELVVAANYNDISAERDRRKAINPNDPMLPYLQAAINQKVADQKAAQAAAGTAAQKAAYDNAFNTWKSLGYATQQIAAILGVPVGAKTASYNIDKLQVAVSQQNANTSSNSLSYRKDKDALDSSTGTYNNYLKMGSDMKNAGTQYQNTFTPRYTDEQINKWVLGLPLDDVTTAKLLSDLGV